MCANRAPDFSISLSLFALASATAHPYPPRARAPPPPPPPPFRSSKTTCSPGRSRPNATGVCGRQRKRVAHSSALDGVTCERASEKESSSVGPTMCAGRKSRSQFCLTTLLLIIIQMGARAPYAPLRHLLPRRSRNSNYLQAALSLSLSGAGQTAARTRRRRRRSLAR